MRLSFHEFDLPLADPFTISRGTVTVQPTLIVELKHEGQRGFGEATTNDYYGITRESMRRSIEEVRTTVEAWNGSNPVSLWQLLDSRLRHDRFAQCALDLAAHDLWGKLQGRPVYELWGLSLDNIPASNFTIGIDTLERMVQKLQDHAGWPVYKIKLGTEHDVEIVAALREHTEAPFRVDANCGWTVEQTLHNARQLAGLGVEFIEQPLPADDWQGAQEVRRNSVLPIIADESCREERDVAPCAEAFNGINIKLVKCGGLTPARRMIAQAEELGLKKMVGCMTESSVGISAIAQLLPLLDYVDMDGAALLAEDIANGVRVSHGRAEFPPTPGCGVELR